MSVKCICGTLSLSLSQRSSSNSNRFAGTSRAVLSSYMAQTTMAPSRNIHSIAVAGFPRCRPSHSPTVSPSLIPSSYGSSSSDYPSSSSCLFVIHKRFFPKMYNKRRRREPLKRNNPRLAKYTKLRMRDEARKKQPVQPMRLKPDRPRTDLDPDPFGYQLNPSSLYPIHTFEEWPLHPGIQSNQFRYGFQIQDMHACGLLMHKQTPEAEDARFDVHSDLHFIQRALSFHNANGKEIRKQLIANEVQRWRFHAYDYGNMEIMIAIHTLKLRSLKGRMDKTTADKQAFYRFAQIYHKRKRIMGALRRVDFGRYKKIMTYLGLRDKFHPSIVRGQGVHRYAHVYSKKKPPGGRAGHLSF